MTIMTTDQAYTELHNTDLDKKAGEPELTKGSDVLKFKETDAETAMLQAASLVEYPVFILPAHYQVNDDYVQAQGRTNTGRNKLFNLVVVDKLDDGDFQSIACVTDTYGTVSISDTYMQLLEQLKEADIPFNVRELYVSGNGGQQQLRLAITGLTNLEGVPDDLEMIVNVTTSVDGTKHHGAHLMGYNKSGEFKVDFFGKDYKLNARHTRTISDRTINFIPTIMEMVKNWEELIQPTLTLMCDEKYDSRMAHSLLEQLAHEAGIGERHRDQLSEWYATDMVETDAEGHSLYKVNMALAQYIAENMDHKPELQERMLDKVARAVDKEVKKIKAR